MAMPPASAAAPQKEIPLFPFADRKEQIARYSLLQKPLELDKDWKMLIASTDPTSQKLFAHIENGTDIGKTNLEGTDFDTVASFFISLLKDHTDLEGIPKLIPVLEAFKQNYQLKDSKEIAKLVNDLQPGQEILLPGGWIGNPGHGMLYHFKRRADRNYDIAIINTGNGTNNHNSQRGVDDKKRIQPLLFFQNVSASKLLLPDHDFFDALTRFNNEAEFVTSNEPDHIYTRIFGHLGDKIAVPPFALTWLSFITAQRSGTCAYNAMKAFILYWLLSAGPDPEKQARIYKKLHFHLKEEVDVVYFQRLEKMLAGGDKSQAETDLLLLRKAAQNLARSVAKCFDPAARTNTITEEEAKIAFFTALDLNERVNRLESELREKRLHSPLIPLPDFSQVFSRPPIDKKAEIEKTIEDQVNNYYFGSLERIDISTSPLRALQAPARAEEILPFLTSVIDEIKSIPDDRQNSYAAIFQIEKATSLLPVPIKEQDIWDAIPKEQVMACMTKLGTLLQSYSGRILFSKESTAMPRRMNTAYALLAATHKLAERQDRELFGMPFNAARSPWGMNADNFLKAIHDPFYVCFDPQDSKKRSELFNYFSLVSGQLFDFQSIDRINNRNASGNLLPILLPESQYFRTLAKAGTPAAQAFSAYRDKLADKLKQEYPELNPDSRADLGLITDVADSGDCPILHVSLLRKAALLASLFTAQIKPKDEDKGLQFPHSDIGVRVGRRLADSNKEAFLSYQIGLISDDAFQVEGTFDFGITPGQAKPTQTLWARGQEYHRVFNEPDEANSNRRVFMQVTPCFERQKTSLSESMSMLQFKLPNSEFPFSKRLASSASEPFFQPRKILHYFMDNMEALSDHEWQLFFDLLFFKPLYFANREFIPLHELMKEAPFQKQALDFIQKGWYVFAEQSSPPDVYGALFFVRLAQRLKQIQPASIPDDLLRQMDLALQHFLRSDAPKDKKCALHLHRAMNGILGASSLKQILISWICASQIPMPKARREPILRAMVQQFVYDHQAEIRGFLADPKRRGELFQDIFAEMGIGNCLPESWNEERFPIYTQTLPDGEEWTVNVLSGMIAKKKMILSNGSVRPADTPSYKTVFGSQEFEMTQSGSKYYFTHPQWGSIELRHLVFAMGFEDVIIRRKDQATGIWYQFMPAGFALGMFPSSLIADHTFWFPTLQKDHVLIFDGLEQVARIDMRDPSKIQLGKYSIVFRDNRQVLGCLEHFERSEWMLIEEDRGEAARITFPRHQSLQGKMLRFDHGKWEDNPEFMLAPFQAGLLHHIENYLCLASPKKRKILVPLQPFIKSDKFQRGKSLEFDPTRKEDDLHPLFQKQKGRYRYLEFDVEESRVVPLNTEGKLFLAYLDLGSKAYSKAIQFLNQISQSETFSDISVSILSQILKNDVILDQAPEALAIRLKAAALLLHSKKPFSGDELIGEYYRRYRVARGHIPEKFRFSSQEEERFQSFDYDPLAPGGFSMPERDLMTGGGFTAYLPSGRFDPAQLRNVILSKNPPAQSHIPYVNLIDHFGRLYAKAKQIRSLEDFLWVRKAIDLARDYSKTSKNSSLTSEPEPIISILHHIILFAAESRYNYLFHRIPDKALELPEPISPQEDAAWLMRAYEICKRNNNEREIQLDLRASQDPTFRENPPATHRLPLFAQPFGGPKEAGGKVSDLLPPASKPLAPLMQGFTAERRLHADQSELFVLKDSDHISKEDEEFAEAMKADLSFFIEEYQAGVKKIGETDQYRFTGNLTHLRAHLEEQKAAMKSRLPLLRKDLERFANATQDIKENALRLGGVKKRIAIIDLKNLLLLDSSDAFRRALPPGRSDQDIANLAAQIVAYERELIAFKQVVRSLKIIEKVFDGEAQNDWQQTLALEIGAETHYDPHKDFVSLIFEDRGDLKIRQDQIAKIQKLLKGEKNGTYCSTISQMMMGGGKTAILAAQLLYIAAKKDRLAVFVVPSAQYQSVKENFIATQKRIFNQDIEAIDIPWKDFTEHNLKDIQTAIDNARKKEQFVLIKQETLQALEVELFAALFNFKLEGEGRDRITILRNILRSVYRHGNALLDEVDLLMLSDKELNRPIGPPKKLDIALVDILGELTRLLTSEKITVKGKTLKEWIGLRSNSQALLDMAFFKDEIRPEILKHFSLKLAPDDQAAFMAYVMGNAPQNDPFAVKLEAWKKQEDTKERAEQIAFLSGLLNDDGGVLLHTLTLSTGRHYGRSLDGSGLVSPYLGVGTPATTKFASVEEAAVLQMATAASQGVIESQVKRSYQKFRKAAGQEARRQAITIDMTESAKRWQEMTGVSFIDMEEKAGSLAKATLAINQGPVENLIAIEKDTILEVVTYYTMFISSNSQNFVSQLASKRGFSGTPWNHVIFDSRQRENIDFEKSVGGQITARMLETVTPDSFHVVKEASVASILGKACHGPNFKRVRALIDVGGFLKNTPDNLAVARDILHFYQNDNSIQYVLFFGRKTASDTPDDLMVLRKDDPAHPIYIGKTRKEELKKFGIKPELAFVYYDERHTEATDILLMDDAVCLKTTGKDVTTRSDAQASMRARKYLTSQDIQYILLEDEMPAFIGNLTTLYEIMKKSPSKETALQCLRSILLTQIMNQAKRKSNLNARAYRHKIDNVFRKKAKDQILELDDIGRSVKVFTSSQKSIITQTPATSFEKFGAIKKREPMKDFLIAYAHDRLEHFEGTPEERQEVTTELDLLTKEIRSTPFLPKTSRSCFSGLGAEQQLLMQEMQQKGSEQQEEVQIENELNQELMRYRGANPAAAFSESLWDGDIRRAADVFGKLRNPKIFTVSQLFKQLPYDVDYGQIFDPDLHITENFARSSKSPLPVFHDSQKSADQILVVAQKGAPLKILLVSVKEAYYLELLLKKERPDDLWLLLSDGREISINAHRALDPDEQIKLDKLLLEANIFNGNAAYLDDRSKEMREKLKTNREQTIRFLKLKVECNPIQKRVLYSSSYLKREEDIVRSVPSPQVARPAPKPLFQAREEFKRAKLEYKSAYNDDD